MRTLSSALATCAAAALVLAASPAAAAPAAAAPAQRAANPHAVLIGGNLDENAEILRSIVDLADPDGAGPAKARIAIVTAAARPARTPEQAADPSLNNAAANGLYYSDLFQQYGAETYAVPVDGADDYPGDEYRPDRADDPAVVAEIDTATGVFFGGGDQMRYVRTLLDCEPAPDEAVTTCADTPVLTALRRAADRGVVAGVSAGLTIQQGSDMVTGGESYEAWRDGATPGYLDDPAELAYVPYGGFGFVEGVQIDSHFATWGRQGRAVKLGLETGHDLVLGVDETTAVVLDRSTGVGRVIGEHGASLLDLSGAVETDGGVEGVRWSYATAGDSINLKRGLVAAADGSAAVRPTSAPVAERSDVWDSLAGDGGMYSLRDLARDTVASSARTGSGTSFEVDPQFRTILTREPQTRAWTTPGGNVSFARLDLRIETVAHSH
ncbi:cyanophycinase [Agromyces sp. M3QZ16-3]|uniref:cyanophycinase n=1 Tax=Agromyces sp. M3QZ16-3 TaxID=3447585 RepID=UPI003F68D015